MLILRALDQRYAIADFFRYDGAVLGQALSEIHLPSPQGLLRDTETAAPSMLCPNHGSSVSNHAALRRQRLD